MDSGEYGSPLLRQTALSVPIVSNSGTVTVGGVRSGNMLLYDGTYQAMGTVPNDGPYSTTKATCTGRLRAQNMVPLAFAGTNYAPEDYRAQLIARNVGSTPFSFDLCQCDDYGPSGARTVLRSFSLVPLGHESASVVVSGRYLEIWGANGAGSLRVQMESKLRWDDLAFAKDDPTTPPILSAPTNITPFQELSAGTDSGAGFS